MSTSPDVLEQIYEKFGVITVGGGPSTVKSVSVDIVSGRTFNCSGDIHCAGVIRGAVEASISPGMGSESNPAICFGADQTTGLYSPIAGTIGFSSGGLNRASISSAGVSATNIVATNITADNLTTTNFTLSGTLTAATVNATSCNVATIAATTADITSLVCDGATIDAGTITNLTSTAVSAGSVDSTTATFSNMTVGNGTITTITAGSVAASGAISGDSITVASASLGIAECTSLTVLGSASATSVAASSAVITSITADTATISTSINVPVITTTNVGTTGLTAATIDATSVSATGAITCASLTAGAGVSCVSLAATGAVSGASISAASGSITTLNSSSITATGAITGATLHGTTVFATSAVLSGSINAVGATLSGTCSAATVTAPAATITTLGSTTGNITTVNCTTANVSGTATASIVAAGTGNITAVNCATVAASGAITAGDITASGIVSAAAIGAGSCTVTTLNGSNGVFSGTVSASGMSTGYTNMSPVAANPGGTATLWINSANGNLYRGAVNLESANSLGGVIFSSTGDIQNVGSMTLTPTAANPGSTTTVWSNSGDSDALYFGNAKVGPGDVVGPGSAANSNIALFDGVSGKLIKDSGVEMVKYNSFDAGGDNGAYLKFANPYFPNDVIYSLVDTYGGNVVMGTTIPINIITASTQAPLQACTFIGWEVAPGVNNTIGAEGMCNTGIGNSALNALTTGSYNDALGFRSLYSLTTGVRNISIGQQSGGVYTVENDNICIGNEGVVGDDRVIRIGGPFQSSNYQAGVRGVTPTGATHAMVVSANGQIGDSSMDLVVSEDPNNAGYYSIYEKFTSNYFAYQGPPGTYTVPIYKTVVDAFTGNVAFGTLMPLDQLQSHADPAQDAIWNTFIGFDCGGTNIYNVGSPSLYNTGVGTHALSLLNGGDANTAIGVEALNNLTTGSWNIGISGGTLYNGNESYNIVIGNNGEAGESQTIRIGSTQTRNFQAGIRGVTAPDGITNAVVIDSKNQLGDSGVQIYSYTRGAYSKKNDAGGDPHGVLLNFVDRLSNNTVIGGIMGTASISSASPGYASGNTFLGCAAGGSNMTADCVYNVGVGLTCCASVTTGYYNVGVGYAALTNLTTGMSNVSIGKFSGSAYIGAESNNILISNVGVAADSGTIRLGTAGTHTTNYQAGIYGVTAHTGEHEIVHIDSTGKLHTVPAGQTMPIGEIYFENSVLYTLALTVNVPAQLAPTTTLVQNVDFDSPGAGQLRYTGTHTRYAHMAFSISGKTNVGTNQLFEFELRKNGVKITGSGFRRKFDNATDYNSLAFHKVVQLATNDIITVYVTNSTDSNGIDVYNLNIVAVVAH